MVMFLWYHSQLNTLLNDPTVRGKASEFLLVYHDKVATTQTYIRSCSFVPLLGVILLCGRLKMTKTRTALVVGGWIRCRLENELHGILYKSLQRAINEMFLRKVEDPSTDISVEQDKIIFIIKDLLR